jgi:hypothetical protein
VAIAEAAARKSLHPPIESPSNDGLSALARRQHLEPLRRADGDCGIHVMTRETSQVAKAYALNTSGCGEGPSSQPRAPSLKLLTEPRERSALRTCYARVVKARGAVGLSLVFGVAMACGTRTGLLPGEQQEPSSGSVGSGGNLSLGGSMQQSVPGCTHHVAEDG